MWIPKWQRDQSRGVESPVPTQVVSNEEFIPRPQTRQQKQVEDLIGRLAEEKAKKLGMERRAFLASSMGMATAFLASNMVFGPHWDVDAAETLEPAATEEKWPKGEFFIFDVQTHFTNGAALAFRNAQFIRNMGFKLENSDEAYAFPNFVKELFFDSETSLVVISGVPGKENLRDASGKVLEGSARTPGLAGKILPSWVMSASGRCARGIARPTITGTARPTRPIRPLCSSRWSARSKSMASIRGSGTAIPIPAVRETASSSMTRK
jgi:uncharacterized protein